MFVPRERGGAGLGLEQAALLQQRLAGAAPATALAINMHLVWTGVARVFADRGVPGLEFVQDGAVAGEVDFQHQLTGKGIEIGLRRSAEVAGGHEDVVHVQQNAAAGAAHQFRQEFALVHLVAGEFQIAGQVFQQDGAAQRVLGFRDVAGDHRRERGPVEDRPRADDRLGQRSEATR